MPVIKDAASSLRHPEQDVTVSVYPAWTRVSFYDPVHEKNFVCTEHFVKNTEATPVFVSYNGRDIIDTVTAGGALEDSRNRESGVFLSSTAGGEVVQVGASDVSGRTP